MPTGYGSQRWSGTRAGVDATVIDALPRRGALLVGKSVTTNVAATVRGSVARNTLHPTPSAHHVGPPEGRRRSRTGCNSEPRVACGRLDRPVASFTGPRR